MEDHFTTLVTEFLSAPSSNDQTNNIGEILEKQTSETVLPFVSRSLPSLLLIEQWTWQMMSKGFQHWVDTDSYVKLFNIIHSFHLKLILNNDGIHPETKIALLLPSNTDWIDGILGQIDSGSEQYVALASQWFDTLSYLAHEIPDVVQSPMIIHINHRLSRDFLMTDKYTSYLKQLRETELSPSIFTSQQRFHLRTCSFSLHVYIWSKSPSFPYTCEEMIEFLKDDFSRMILVRSNSIDSWSNDLLSCMAHTVGVICSLCWWNDRKADLLKLIVPSKDIKHVQLLAWIRLVSYQPFYQRISARFYNDETLLIDTALIFIFGVVETQHLGCFINTKTQLPKLLLTIATTPVYDRIRVCAYGFLAEILNDEQLKELEIADNIGAFFYYIIEQAWAQPTKKWKKIPIEYLIKGLLSLSSNDSIQTATAQSNKLPLLIELSERYPLAFDILWALSFNSIIVQQLKSDQTFRSKLVQINHETKDESLRKAVSGLLWNLHSGRDDGPAVNVVRKEKSFDIMISYCHREREICKKLYEELGRSGYRVWIDFDQMHGNVMDAMAQAIEQSRTILICMSEQYRRSNYCRAEAQYAFQKQLHIVPILLQKHYKPDGWLSFLIGTLLYIDFTKHEYPKALDMLMKELELAHKPFTEPSPPKFETIASLAMISGFKQSRSPAMTLPDNVQDWSEAHVQHWLMKNNLPQMTQLLSNMDGPGLAYFSEYLIKNEPQKILALLQQDTLRLTHENLSLIEISRFRSLIEKEHTFRSMPREGMTGKDSKATYSTCCSVM